MTSSSLHDLRLIWIDLPDHPCPWDLKTIRLRQEQPLPLQDHRPLSQEGVDGLKAARGVATTPQRCAATERIGGYSDLAAPVLAGGLSGVMGIALCLLALQSLMDGQAFAASLRKDDLLSQRWRAWTPAPRRWWALASCCGRNCPMPQD